jgi:beta-glucosidase
MVRPLKELKGFGRVTLQPGEAAQVSFSLPVDMLNFTGYAGQRIVEPGEFDLMIGASSSNILLQTRVQVVGNVRTLPCHWRMQSEFHTHSVSPDH